MLRFLLASALLALSFTIIPSAAQAQLVEDEEHCVVNIKTTDALNVRSKPSASAKVVGQFDYAECGIVVVDECVGNWCPVEDGHVAGWVNSRYISMVSPALYCVSGVRPGDRLNLRAWPAATSRVLTQLGRHQCDIAFLPYAVGSWQKIRVRGWEGWASRNYLSGQ